MKKHTFLVISASLLTLFTQPLVHASDLKMQTELDVIAYEVQSIPLTKFVVEGETFIRAYPNTSDREQDMQENLSFYTPHSEDYFESFAQKETPASGQVTYSKSKAKIKTLLVHEIYRTKGIGSLLFKESIQDITTEHPVAYFDATESAIPFYKKHGAKKVKPISTCETNWGTCTRMYIAANHSKSEEA